MDTLPIELLRLIFEYADVTTVRTMRLVAPLLAEVGYDYMLAAEFTVLRRTNDADRLQNIASHPRLSGSIQALTLNFSERIYHSPARSIMSQITWEPLGLSSS
jgi:hypothetical protein